MLVPFRLAGLFLSLLLLLSAGLLATLGERFYPMAAWLSLMGMWVVGWVVVNLYRGNLIGLPVLFALFYIVYISAPTMELLLTGNVAKDNLLIQRSVGDFAYATNTVALLGGVGLWAFAAGLMVVQSWARGKPVPPREGVLRIQGGEIPSWVFPLGLMAFFLGVFLYFLDLARLGGWQALLTPRVERLYALSEARGSLPYAPIVFSGIALLTIGSFRRTGLNSVRGLFFIALAAWVLFLLLQGDRRYLLYTFLLIAGIYVAFKGFSWKLSLKSFLMLFAVYLILSFFGAVRWLLTPLLSGGLGLGEALAWVQSNISWSWFLPSNNEFVGPYLTLLMTLTNRSWWDVAGAPLWGFSYVASLANLLPRSLYPGEKWLPLSFQFSDWYYANYTPDWPAPVGFGFSPLAEALLNFGNTFLAPVVPLFALGLFMGWLSVRAQLKPLPWGLICALLMPQTFNLNRIDFPWAFQEGVYYVFVGLGLWYGGSLLLRRKRGGSLQRPSST